MLSKVCASWLIVLVLLPFTAPFSMFDLTEVLSRPGGASMGTPSSPTPMAALTRAALSREVSFPMRAARHRPALTRLRAASILAIAPVPTSRSYGALAINIVHPLTCPIVLRI
jgi:hypothetical protein